MYIVTLLVLINVRVLLKLCTSHVLFKILLYQRLYQFYPLKVSYLKKLQIRVQGHVHDYGTLCTLCTI